MRNYFKKQPSGAPLLTLSKLYDVPVGFVTPPPYFEAVYCFICGRRRMAIARYRMICLDRPKSVRNRCVIEVFGGVFVSLDTEDMPFAADGEVLSYTSISKCMYKRAKTLISVSGHCGLKSTLVQMENTSKSVRILST